MTDVIVDDSSGGIGQQARTYYPDSRLDYGTSNVNRPNMFVANATYYLPKLQGASLLERGTLGGWELTGIVTAQNGNNFTLYQGAHEANLATTIGPTGIPQPQTSQLNQNGALAETGYPSPQRPLPNRAKLRHRPQLEPGRQRGRLYARRLRARHPAQ